MCESISHKEIEESINSIEGIKPEEKHEYHRKVIEEMLQNGYSEEKVWEHCQIEIDSIEEALQDASITEMNLQERLSSDSLTTKTETLLNKVLMVNKNHQHDLKSLIRSFKHFQVHYCKSFTKNASNENNSKESKTKSSYSSINWNISKEQLENLINLLKDKALIEDCDEDDLAMSILKGRTEKHLNWTKKKALLAYFIEQLDNSLISPDNIWADTSPYFLWKGKPVKPNQLKSSADQYKNNKKMKPLNYEVIDKIIDRTKNIDHH